MKSKTKIRAADAASQTTPAEPRSIGQTPRKIEGISALCDESRASMRYQSPLRYPGAKSTLVGVIADLLSAAAESLGKPQLLVEPFAGGASTSLRLAGSGVVERVLLADADPLVARFWQVAAAETDWLVDRMWDEPVTLARWDYWRSWKPSKPTDREIAVKCLFLNRTTFSGILHGRAGPIGGRKQESDYTIDCRFNKEALERRLRYVGDLYASHRLVDVWCKDWNTTLDDVAEWYPHLVPDRVVAYLDPPYVEKSPTLYPRSFDPYGGYAAQGGDDGVDREGWRSGPEHYRLASYLRHSAQYRWVLSYDRHESLLTDRRLYSTSRMWPAGRQPPKDAARWRISKRLVEGRYTASASVDVRHKPELLITTLPPSCVVANKALRQLN